MRIAFLESDVRILPDMGVKVSFMEDRPVAAQVATEFKGVFLPSSAIVTRENENVVFVVKDSRVEIRQILIGLKQGSQRNIRSGVEAGEWVVRKVTPELSETLVDGRQVVAI